MQGIEQDRHELAHLLGREICGHRHVKKSGQKIKGESGVYAVRRRRELFLQPKFFARIDFS